MKMYGVVRRVRSNNKIKAVYIDGDDNTKRCHESKSKAEAQRDEMNKVHGVKCEYVVVEFEGD